MGVLSLVVLAVPGFGALVALTLIGLPLAVAYWATPAVFMLCLIAYVINRILPLAGKTGAALSLVAAAATLAVPPYLLNGPVHRNAASLAAGDLDALQLPITARSIASRQNFRFGKEVTQCGGFCLHVLLTGTADRFLVADTDTPHGDIAPDQEAIEFRLERRDACPPVYFKPGTYTLTFPAANGDTARAADPVETLKLRAIEGECLVSRPATLGDADIVISRGAVTKGVHRRSDTGGYSFSTETASANRIAVHRKAGDTRFDEVYRNTQVRYRLFGWLLVPSVTMNSSFKVSTGWWRRENWINVQSRYDHPHAWTTFLTQKLGLDLKLEGEDTKAKTLARLRKLLDEGTPPNPADWALFSQYFDRIGAGSNTKMSAEDFELGLRVLGNAEFPAPPSPHNLIRYVERNAGDAEMAHLVGLFVERLNGDAARHQALGARPEDQIKLLSNVVRRLPDAALLPHKDTMISLASRPDIQRHGYVALRRLSVYGDDAVPALLTLMKAGFDGGEHFYRYHRYQNPYLGGMQGLCLAGARAASALPELRQLTAEGKLPNHGSHGRLLFTTLLRLGEDRDRVRTLFMAAARNKANATDEHFDALAARASGEKPPCHF